MQLKDVKRVMLNKRPVTYENHQYTIYACRLRLGKDKWEYDLELLDKNQNTIVVVDLNEVAETEYCNID